MPRLAKYLLTLLLIVPILACGLGSQPLENEQNASSTPDVLASAPPVETIQAESTELPITTVESYSEYENMLNPQGTPVSEWNGIPVMPQAIAGQAFEMDRYSYKAEVGSEEAQGFYRDNLSGLGWNESFSLPADANAGAVIVFEKGSSILTITFTSMDDYLLVILNLV